MSEFRTYDEGASLPPFPLAQAEQEAELEAAAGLTAFDYDLETHRIRVVGHTPDEVRALLAAYREHLHLLSDLAQQNQGLGDAFRSGPADPG
jgi:hypothetical protein